jgi:hypothetical protein
MTQSKKEGTTHMVKDWSNAKFLDITKYQTSEPTVITLFPDLFDSIFAEQDRLSAFINFKDFYYQSSMTEQDAKEILLSMKICETCEEWFVDDELIDTEMMVGGGVGLVCSDCASTLG